MRPEQYPTSKLVQWLEKERILTLDRVAEALGRPARITLFRKLAQLGSRASYSHRGRYHTLDRIADYDEDGLWSFRGVQFSQHGTLGETIVSLVKRSEAGCFASEHIESAHRFAHRQIVAAKWPLPPALARLPSGRLLPC